MLFHIYSISSHLKLYQVIDPLVKDIHYSKIDLLIEDISSN